MLKPKSNLQPIENQRMRLRLLERGDLEMTRQWRNQDSVRRWFVHSEIISAEQHQQWFEAYLSKDDDFVFIIEDTMALKRPIGQIALYNIEWDQRRAEFGRLMVGDLEARGRGFAKDAVMLLLEFAERAWRIDKTYLYVYANNYPAIKVYQSTGFIPVEKVDDMVYMIR